MDLTSQIEYPRIYGTNVTPEVDSRTRIESTRISDSNVKLSDCIRIVSKLSHFTVSAKSAIVNELPKYPIGNSFHLPIGKLDFGVNFFGGYSLGHKGVYYEAHIGPTLNQGEGFFRSLITPTIWMISNPITPITPHSVSRLREINQFRVHNQISVPNQVSRIEEVISRDSSPSQLILSRRTRRLASSTPLTLNGVTMLETADTIVSALPVVDTVVLVPNVRSTYIEVINTQTNQVTSMIPVEAQLLLAAVVITSFLSSLCSAGARLNEGMNSSTIVGPQVGFFGKKISQVSQIIGLGNVVGGGGGGDGGGGLSLIGDAIKERTRTRRLFQMRWFIFGTIVIFCGLIFTDLILNNGQTLQTIFSTNPRVNKEVLLKDSMVGSFSKELSPFVDAFNVFLKYIFILACFVVVLLSIEPVLRVSLVCFKFVSFRLLKQKNSIIDVDYWYPEEENKIIIPSINQNK